MVRELKPDGTYVILKPGTQPWVEVQSIIIDEIKPEEQSFPSFSIEANTDDN